MYHYFGADVLTYLPELAAHCVPTDNYGGPCPIHDFSINDGLNNCGKESIFEMFAHFCGSSYTAPLSSSTPPTGTFYDFDQSQFTTTSDPQKDFMNPTGGIYIPKACTDPNNTCKLHVAFHGCLQSIYSNYIDDLYAKKAGFFQVADANNVIVVFPRAADFAVDVDELETNASCWDWLGIAVSDTTTTGMKEAPQVKAIRKILNAVIGQTLF